MEQIVQIIKKILPAVVSISVSKYLDFLERPLSPFYPFGEPGISGSGGTTKRKKVHIGGGSGFLIDPSGIILTNRHVVADPEAEYIVLLNNDKRYKAQVVAKDPINDVAILKIETTEKNLPTVELGDSSQLELGQTVVAVGNALGTFQNTVSAGVISGLSRQITAFSGFDHRMQRLRGLIQTDAAINPGNSGGPLVDLEGRAIGINAAMVFGAENIGFALPINSAKKDLEDLKKYGRIIQPFLGVRYVVITKELQKKYNLPTKMGALILSENIPDGQAVIPDSPAAKAGLQEGDIILEVEREKVSTKSPLEDILQKFKVGDSVEIKFLQKGKEKSCKVILAERK
jgi:serine protease Do